MSNSTIYKALILVGKTDLDSSDSKFNWAKVLTKNALDKDGNPVTNPGNVMIYGAKGLSLGDCEELLLSARGIDGLFDVIPAEATATVLEKMHLTMEEIPEVPLAESSASSMSRADASARARSRRRERGNTAAAETATETEKETQTA